MQTQAKAQRINDSTAYFLPIDKGQFAIMPKEISLLASNHVPTVRI